MPRRHTVHTCSHEHLTRRFIRAPIQRTARLHTDAVARDRSQGPGYCTHAPLNALTHNHARTMQRHSACHTCHVVHQQQEMPQVDVRPFSGDHVSKLVQQHATSGLDSKHLRSDATTQTVWHTNGTRGTRRKTLPRTFSTSNTLLHDVRLKSTSGSVSTPRKLEPSTSYMHSSRARSAERRGCTFLTPGTPRSRCKPQPPPPQQQQRQLCANHTRSTQHTCRRVRTTLFSMWCSSS
jgi:hypothetical protein